MKYRNFLIFIKSIFLIQVFIVIIIFGVSVDINGSYLEDFASLNMRNILIPFSNINIDVSSASSLFKEANVVLAGEKIGTTFPTSYYKKKIPEDLMVSNFQVLAYGNKQLNKVNIISNNNEKNKEKVEPVAVTLVEEPVKKQTDYSSLFTGCKVVFYCTHSAESYIPNSGKARCEGKRGLVNEVALRIASGLKNQGLDTDFIDTIHDYPEYNKGYTNSRNTVKSVLNDSNENILALFDIHRDSIPGLASAKTVNINGKPAATILIIVGTDERKPHPEWRENLKFAEKIYIQGEKRYPGLIKGVRTKAGTYNQEFHNHALLLEFGSDYNSLAEANYAGKLFTDILLDVLKEEVK